MFGKTTSTTPTEPLCAPQTNNGPSCKQQIPHFEAMDTQDPWNRRICSRPGPVRWPRRGLRRGVVGQRDAVPPGCPPHPPGTALFAAYRQDAVFANSTASMLTAESEHRDHAVVEQVVADLKGSALAHSRWHRERQRSMAGLRGDRLQPDPGDRVPGRRTLAKARTSTIRTRLLTIPARIANTGRATVLHLLRDHHHQHRFLVVLDKVQAPPRSARPTSTTRTNRHPVGDHPLPSTRTRHHQHQLLDSKINMQVTRWIEVQGGSSELLAPSIGGRREGRSSARTVGQDLSCPSSARRISVSTVKQK